MSRLEETPATVAFLAGKLDALVFASAPESLMVQMLLQTPGVQLLDFAQHEAYARRFPFLTPVTLPRGVVDLAANVPTRDVRLVATTTSLLARDGTHPALLTLFPEEPFEVGGEVLPGRHRRLCTTVVLGLEHGEVERRLAIVGDRLVVQQAPPGDVVGEPCMAGRDVEDVLEMLEQCHRRLRVTRIAQIVRHPHAQRHCRDPGRVEPLLEH
eukprot:gene35084-57973_t